MFNMNNIIVMKTKLDLVYNLLVASLFLVILTTFVKIVDNGEGVQLNLYGQLNGFFSSTLFLMSSLVELGAILKRNERLFIALRIINTLWVFKLIGSVLTIVRDSQTFAFNANTIKTIAQFGFGIFTGWALHLEKQRLLV